ncbi:hypothetical protein CBR_g41635 [Chara braunii]|uniref:HTH CENPB-type domain-containing protein n=1 Tax=Chara braunii TaxID=69332 RepID=A0A388LWE2_CHABU|nr:hypothetical protein CBR_g41635 [Chara braunii]|eukprot:GBG86573.1 hypothetical protein CBR_g41635 [Chara braunii]
MGLTDKLEQALKNTMTNSRTQRRLGGGGRKPEHEELEEQLEQWVLQKNTRGLRVRDQYIQAKARLIFKLQKERDEVEEDAAFDGSTCWMARFKRRKGFVSRRHTTSRTLPSNAADTCRAFIDEIHSVIDKHKISPLNIFSMDQVPRYFETEPSSTITKRWTREVLMRKANSSHKRFTVTFTISMAGEMMKPHLLFAKLKNKPGVEGPVAVDVNMTGMWSTDTIISFINDTIASRKAATFGRQPVLLIIDSYGPHVKVAESERLKKMNIHQSYECQYDAYISKALEDPSLQTKMGNPKTPTYQMVADWVCLWAKTKTKEDIAQAFTMRGLVCKEDFDVEKLHPPLRALYNDVVNIDDWNDQYAQDFAEAPVPVNMDLLTAPEYFILEDTFDGQPNSYWQCLRRAVLGRASSVTCAEFRSNTVSYMKTMEILADITDNAYFVDLASGTTCDEEYIACAISEIQNVTIRIQRREDSSYRTFERSDTAGIIDLVCVDGFYVLKL